MPSDDAVPRSPSARRPPWAAAVLGIAGCLAFAALVALGTWQVHRLRWKLDLIARVDARVHAAPVPAPGPESWAGLTREVAEYRRITARGTFDNGRETHVQALTELGSGSWVVTPLRTDAGFTVLVNRGFVPPDRRDPASRPDGQVAGETVVTGLLRLTEPAGSLLQSNDPAADVWVSRDVAAIARARGLDGPVAPYFIDADAALPPGRVPVGGLTVVSFPNNHLAYALTWYGLAALLAGAGAWRSRGLWRRGVGTRVAGEGRR